MTEKRLVFGSLESKREAVIEAGKAADYSCSVCGRAVSILDPEDSTRCNWCRALLCTACECDCDEQSDSPEFDEVEDYGDD